MQRVGEDAARNGYPTADGSEISDVRENGCGSDAQARNFLRMEG
jgi:hypothetical protein